MKNEAIALMRQAVESAGEVIHGDQPHEIAEQWIDAGFTSDEAKAWWDAGAFDAASAAELRDAGIAPEDVGMISDREMPAENVTIAYWHSNGDMDLDAVRAAIAGEEAGR